MFPTRASSRLLGAALFPLLLAGCDAEAVELAREIEAARGNCTREGLRASDEACVQMMERYAGMGTELMHTYIGGMKALDQALDRMPPPDFDTVGLGYALSPEFRSGDPFAAGGSPRFERALAPAASRALSADPASFQDPRLRRAPPTSGREAMEARAAGRSRGFEGPERYGAPLRDDRYGYDPYGGYGRYDRRPRPRPDRYGWESERELLRERYGPLSGDRWFYLDRYESGAAGRSPGYGYTPFGGYLPPYGGLARAWSYGPAIPFGNYGGYGPGGYAGYGVGGYGGYDYGGYGYGAYGYDGYGSPRYGYAPDYRGYAGAYDPYASGHDGYAPRYEGYGGRGYGPGEGDPYAAERGYGAPEPYDDSAADGYGGRDPDGRTPADDWGYAAGEAMGPDEPPLDAAAAGSPVPARPAPHRPGILLPPGERLRRPWLDD